MTIITRILRLFKADVHGILDCIEEPQAVLKQAIRDMEAELERENGELKATQERVNRAEAQVSRIQVELTQCQHEIELCLAAHNDALARATVRKKLELENIEKAARLSCSTLQSEVQRLSARVKEGQDKLRGIKEKAELAAHCALVGETQECRPVSESDVEVAFLREQQNFAAKQNIQQQP